MKDKIKKYIKEGALLLGVLIIAMNGISYYKSLDLNKDTLSINNFVLLDNSKYEIQKDKPILLYFWATWCPICKLESPNIENISKYYEVITIAVQSGTNEEIKNYLEKHKLKFNVVNDEDGFYSQNFNIKVFPTTLIYDRDKKLKFSDVGYTSTLGLFTRVLLSK